MTLLREQFVKDRPKNRGELHDKGRNLIADPITGCTAFRLMESGDERGYLVELLTARDEPIDPIVHVYQVFAGPGSVRAWVFHQRQDDRLCFTIGRFRVVLYDLREDGPTYGKINELLVGEETKIVLTIPPLVAHGVQNLGDATSSFINMPTRPYDHADPDKYRLPADTTLVPYSFKK